MMDKVSLLQRALAALRVAQDTRTPPSPHRVSAANTRPAIALKPPPSDVSPSLQETLRRRLVAIDPRDPEQRSRMLRVTLQVCLAAEWRPEVESDPEFHSLVDQVHRQMEADPALQPLIDEALKIMTAPSAP